MDVVMDSRLAMSQQCAFMAKKANDNVVRLCLVSCVLFWVPQFKKDSDILVEDHKDYSGPGAFPL